MIFQLLSVFFTGFLNDLVNEKAIFVLNKSDLGVNEICDEIKKHGGKL